MPSALPATIDGDTAPFDFNGNKRTDISQLSGVENRTEFPDSAIPDKEFYAMKDCIFCRSDLLCNFSERPVFERKSTLNTCEQIPFSSR